MYLPPLGPSKSPLGALLGPSWGDLGRSGGRLGGLLGPCWAILGPSWGHLEASKAHRKRKNERQHSIDIHEVLEGCWPPSSKSLVVIAMVCRKSSEDPLLSTFTGIISGASQDPLETFSAASQDPLWDLQGHPGGLLGSHPRASPEPAPRAIRSFFWFELQKTSCAAPARGRPQRQHGWIGRPSS